MRILLWHGYLLGGTGSNAYTCLMAREWSRAGHDVVVVCQERHPERYGVGGARVVRPELPSRLLPVFVLDHYDGLEARRLPELSRAEREAFVDANAAVLRELGPADLVMANHALLGGPVGMASRLPFAVKVHGSELEYSIRGNQELGMWARETLAGAHAVFVGSAHIRDVLEEVVGHIDRVHEVPPGVDVEEFRPQPRAAALSALLEQARSDPPNPDNANGWLPDEGNAERLARFFAEEAPTVVYFGRLLREKGVHLLLEALRGLNARAVIVGSGNSRAELEALAAPRTLFTGQLGHRHLTNLLPLADVVVVPSIFPEAFGMVAAEAAAVGVPPLVARHSGLAEVAARIEAEYPAGYRHLVSFPRGDVNGLREALRDLLALSPVEREVLGAAARRAVEAHWDLRRIAEQVLSLSVNRR